MCITPSKIPHYTFYVPTNICFLRIRDTAIMNSLYLKFFVKISEQEISQFTIKHVGGSIEVSPNLTTRYDD